MMNSDGMPIEFLGDGGVECFGQFLSQGHCQNPWVQKAGLAALAEQFFAGDPKLLCHGFNDGVYGAWNGALADRRCLPPSLGGYGPVPGGDKISCTFRSESAIIIIRVG